MQFDSSISGSGYVCECVCRQVALSSEPLFDSCIRAITRRPLNLLLLLPLLVKPTEISSIRRLCSFLHLRYRFSVHSSLFCHLLSNVFFFRRARFSLWRLITSTNWTDCWRIYHLLLPYYNVCFTLVYSFSLFISFGSPDQSESSEGRQETQKSSPSFVPCSLCSICLVLLNCLTKSRKCPHNGERSVNNSNN